MSDTKPRPDEGPDPTPDEGPDPMPASSPSSTPAGESATAEEPAAAVEPATADEPAPAVDAVGDDTSDPHESAAGDSSPAGPGTDRAAEGRRRTLVTVGAVTAVLAVPIVVAVVAVRTPPWYPLVDLAQIEMRVRDVGTAHPPLTGLGGRIFGLDIQGSHPGPLSFYLLAPVYRLLGGTPWGLQVSAAVLNVAVLAGTVWATYRRWGVHGALLMAAGLAVLMRMYGTVILLYPWNPYMPVLFWMLFLVCVWGVLCGDLVLLPIAVVAGCLCAQTHIPYVGLVGGMGALVVLGLAWQHRQARGDAAARRRVVRWALGSLLLGVLLWVPVFVEQAGGDPGNISILVDSFSNPTDDPVGLSTGWRLLVEHLDVVRLFDANRVDTQPSRVPGIGLLVVWAASAAVAARLRDRALVALHVVVAGALLLGLVTISRIFGATWFYLTLWAFGTATLTLVAVVATAALAGRAALARRDHAHRLARVARAPLALLGVAILVPTALLTRAAPDTADVDAAESDQLGAVVGPTVDAIESGVIPGGDDGTFFMSWADPVNLGGQGLGLMLELERRGYDARTSRHTELSVRPHRVVPREEADAEIHVAVGVANIDRARAHPGAVEIAIEDPRTPEQIELYVSMRERVIDNLVAAGMDDLVPQVDSNIFALAAHKGLPESVATPLYILGNQPQPIGVFTWDPTS